MLIQCQAPRVAKMLAAMLGRFSSHGFQAGPARSVRVCRSVYAIPALVIASMSAVADPAFPPGPPPVEVSGVVDANITNTVNANIANKVNVSVDGPVQATVINTLPLDRVFSLGFVDVEPVLGDAPRVELPVGKYLIHDITLNLVASEDAICRGFASLLYPEDGETLSLTLAISIAASQPKSYVRNFTPPIEFDSLQGNPVQVRLGFTALTECDFIGTNILMEKVAAE